MWDTADLDPARLNAGSPHPGEQTGYSGGTYDAVKPNTPWQDYQHYAHNHEVKHLRIGWSRVAADVTLARVDNKTL